METYFKIKVLLDYVIPIIIIAVIVIIYILLAVLSTLNDAKKKKYMLSHGYEYYLRTVASFGGKVWWAYKKDGNSIDEEDLFKMKFSDIKKRFK